MAKIQNISEIHPTLGFTEFDIVEKYRKSFKEGYSVNVLKNKMSYENDRLISSHIPFLL